MLYLIRLFLLGFSKLLAEKAECRSAYKRRNCQNNRAHNDCLLFSFNKFQIKVLKRCALLRQLFRKCRAFRSALLTVLIIHGNSILSNIILQNVICLDSIYLL